MSKYALVTGASRSIGRAIALALAEEDFEIFVNYATNKQAAETVAKEIKTKAYLVPGDVSDENEMKKVFDKVQKIAGKLDLLVNNAGMDYLYDIESYPLEKMKQVVEVNLFGVFITTKLALPFLKKSSNGQIINIASRLGQEKIIEKAAAYSAAKGGVIRFTKCCALEFRKYRIKVNAVLPGFTRTDMTESFYDQAVFDKAAENNPRGRVGKPEDVANVVAFLASNKADYINGETIGVNGGSNLI